MTKHRRNPLVALLGVAVAGLIAVPTAGLAQAADPPVTPGCTINADGTQTVLPTSQTYKNLMAAMHGEALAYAKYTDFATIATAAGLTDVAKLFTDTAKTEREEHLGEEATLLGLVGTTAQNLQDAIDGETYETTTMYPDMAKRANAAGDTQAGKKFANIATEEAVHVQNFTLAKATLTKATDPMPANPVVEKVAGPVPDPADPPRLAKVKAQGTMDDLQTAMQGEAFAYIKYLLYADQAKADGRADIAALFTATAQVERYEHLWEEFALSGMWGTTAENLKNSIAGETYETTTMYPGFAKTAAAEGCSDVAKRFYEIAVDEGNHNLAYQTALQGLTPRTPAGCLTNADGTQTVLPTSQTYQNLLTAMHGEAFAYSKYTGFAEIATAAGLKDAADAFTAAANQEKGEHFFEEAKALGLVGTTYNNLSDAIKGETDEVTKMYPDMATNATKAGDTNAAKLFTEIAGDEGKHAGFYQEAQAWLQGVVKAVVPAGQIPPQSPAPLVPGPAQVKGPTTLDDLSTAMHGEAFAYLKYLLYADQATTDQYPTIATLFSNTAGVERFEHFREEAALAGLWGDTAANLKDAIAGETYENQTMYPGFATTASEEGCTAVAALFSDTGGDEGKHAAAFTTALDKITPPPACLVNGLVSPGTATYANLMTAMKGEAFAYAKYTDFGAIATGAELKDTGTLFTDTAAVERFDHLAMEAQLYGLVSADTAVNLQAAIAGEMDENTMMYPGYRDAAAAVGDTVAANLFGDIGGDELGHADAYQAALQWLSGAPGVTVPAGPTAIVKPIKAQAAQVSNKQTLANLQAAMHGEALAYVKYLLYADAADKQGYADIAKLFRATSQVERYEHFREEAMVAGLFGDTTANLTDSINGETYETTSMYPSFAAQALAEGCGQVASMFTEIAADELAHANAFSGALKALTAPGKGSPKGPAVGTGGTVLTGGAGQSTSAAGLLAAAVLLGAALVVVRVWRRQRVPQ